jgi:hypothetical protein
VILAAVLVAAFVACTSGGETYTLVTDCLQEVVNDAGCESGSPYVCENAALPSDTDPTLVCENGFPSANGSTTFCCTSSSASSSCSYSSAITCGAGQNGYTCTGTDSPSSFDSTLVCEAQPQSGANVYCCIADAGTTSSSCTEEPDGGCTGSANFFVCPASTTPIAIDPTLNCSAPTVLSGGFASYCCTN